MPVGKSDYVMQHATCKHYIYTEKMAVISQVGPCSKVAYQLFVDNCHNPHKPMHLCRVAGCHTVRGVG